MNRVHGSGSPRPEAAGCGDGRCTWARFSSWLECVCVVTFDLELGQALELVFPQDVKLTEKEKTSICYLSFPDSYSGCIGDTQFSFRFRQSVGRRASRFREDVYNREAPPTLQTEASHFFGYVYFRQVKDVSVKRGYFQKSLVLVSKLPYTHLFHSLLQIVAPEFFEKLEPCLEAVCNGIDQWPSPAPGLTLNLPVMGMVLQQKQPNSLLSPPRPAVPLTRHPAWLSAGNHRRCHQAHPRRRFPGACSPSSSCPSRPSGRGWSRYLQWLSGSSSSSREQAAAAGSKQQQQQGASSNSSSNSSRELAAAAAGSKQQQQQQQGASSNSSSSREQAAAAAGN